MGSLGAYFRFRRMAEQFCTGYKSTSARSENIAELGSIHIVEGMGNLETGVSRTGAVAKHFSKNAVSVDLPHVSCSLAAMDRVRMAK
jgi:hypothetical protein